MNPTSLPPKTVCQSCFLALVVLVTSCSTSGEIDKAAKKAGVPGGRLDTSILVGTFENMSVRPFGPRCVKLWDQLASTGGPWDGTKKRVTASEFSDHVRIRSADGGVLLCELISAGSVRETRKIPFTCEGRHLVVQSSSSFNWLPLGYRTSSSTLALTAVANGDLIVLHQFEVGGIVMLIGSAGDSGVIDFRYPRLDSQGGYTKESKASLATAKQRRL